MSISKEQFEANRAILIMRDSICAESIKMHKSLINKFVFTFSNMNNEFNIHIFIKIISDYCSNDNVNNILHGYSFNWDLISDCEVHISLTLNVIRHIQIEQQVIS